MKDLVVLVADLDIEKAINALLAKRLPSLGIRSITHFTARHLMHDNGCRTDSLAVLGPLRSGYRHALVVFDREGCGTEHLPREEIELAVEAQLMAGGWDRCAAIVLDPEIESWVWSPSPELDQVIGWAGKKPSLRDWLKQRNEALQPNGKPVRPKEALDAALRESDTPRSAALFGELAARVGLGRCTDPSFAKLKATLQRWFPA